MTTPGRSRHPVEERGQGGEVARVAGAFGEHGLVTTPGSGPQSPPRSSRSDIGIAARQAAVPSGGASRDRGSRFAPPTLARSVRTAIAMSLTEQKPPPRWEDAWWKPPNRFIVGPVWPRPPAPPRWCHRGQADRGHHLVDGISRDPRRRCAPGLAPRATRGTTRVPAQRFVGGARWSRDQGRTILRSEIPGDVIGAAERAAGRPLQHGIVAVGGIEKKTATIPGRPGGACR